MSKDYKIIADPFIIAKAYNLKGCIVTEEDKKPNSGRIPIICDKYEIECINLEKFLLENNLVF